MSMMKTITTATWMSFQRILGSWVLFSCLALLFGVKHVQTWTVRPRLPYSTPYIVSTTFLLYPQLHPSL
jgi:hypothetical protein